MITKNMAAKELDCPLESIKVSELTRDDRYFMVRAYNLALDGWRKGEIPVGAIIAKDGRILAQAHNLVETLHDPTAHAEMLAITQAAKSLGDWRCSGATLYVTKEPCPMCAGALLLARLERVLYGLGDPQMGGLDGRINLASLDGFHHTLTAQKGPMEDECRELLQTFFRLRRRQEEAGRSPSR